MNSEKGSPRLSFSRDDALPLKQDEYSREDPLLLDSTSEFEFNISSSHEHESSSADELFSNGVILPLQINRAHKQTYYEKLPCSPSSLLTRSCPPSVERTKKNESCKEVADVSSLHAKKSQSKSFWGFKRSKSLNCDSKRNMICSFPFLLSRSKSTGSVPNPKRTASKDSQKHNSYKQLVMTKSTSSSTSSSLASAASSYSSMQQKPPLNKSHGGYYGNGVRVSPVLNVPPSYISKGTANLLGFGSIFSCGKDKRSKR